MDKRNIIIGLLSLMLVAALVVLIFNPGQEKTAYVELNKLFDEFKLKKELQGELEKIKTARKNITDSLEFELKVMVKEIQAEGQKDKARIAQFELKREQYVEKKKQFEADNSAVGKQFDEQIIGQLNQYVKDYGEKNGYTYIFGADGSGFLMFSAAKKNLTEEMKIYINERYKGKTQ
jgi:outer membrane protein